MQRGRRAESEPDLVLHLRTLGALDFSTGDGRMFWPDADQQHARGALSQALTRIRRQARQDILQLRGRNEIRATPGGIGELAGAAADTTTAVRYFGAFAELWSEADPVLQPQVRATQGRLNRLLQER